MDVLRTPDEHLRGCGLSRAKVLAVRERLPHLKTIIVIGAGANGSAFLDWDRLLAAASDRFATVDTAAEGPVEGGGRRTRAGQVPCCARRDRTFTLGLFHGLRLAQRCRRRV